MKDLIAPLAITLALAVSFAYVTFRGRRNNRRARTKPLSWGKDYPISELEIETDLSSDETIRLLADLIASRPADNPPPNE